MSGQEISSYQIRPLPYVSLTGTAAERALARALRVEFVSKVRRLLPGHHLGGYRHDTVVRFVGRAKGRYPCFISTDIRQFYPSVRHEDLLTYCQVAYRDLLSLEYVPRTFRRKYVGPVAAWLRSLPLHRGIPVGSPLSGILAPVMLLPLWLRIKRLYGVPLLVYMDDILICTQDERQSAEIYAYLDRCLWEDYGLELNREKTCSGRFASVTATFCGWQFAGGYARISPGKVEAFRGRIRELVRRVQKEDTRAFVKRINRKIDGFGHYYKFGQVRAEYRALDQFLRQEVRRWYQRTHGVKLYHVERLAALGLHSLEAILAGAGPA